MPNWATLIGAGAPNESTQTLDFQVSNNHNDLFAVQPTIATNGTLTYTPALNANGVAMVTVRLHDTGGGTGEPSPGWLVTLAWLAVGIPMAWGMWMTLQKAAPLLFR